MASGGGTPGASGQHGKDGILPSKKMLFDCSPRWLETARLLLRRGGQLGYDKQLFLLNQGSGDITASALSTL